MNSKEMIEIIDSVGNKSIFELVTFLISDDGLRQYIVYTKNEIKGENDQVIYISRLFKTELGYKIEEIIDDIEWNDVQHLLKKIANV